MLKPVIAAALFTLACGPALGQSKTLTVAVYGGSWEQQLRKDVIPAFEQKHGVKVEYVAGNSTDTLAKLQAQKGNQVIDVAIVDVDFDLEGGLATVRAARCVSKKSARRSKKRTRSPSATNPCGSCANSR